MTKKPAPAKIPTARQQALALLSLVLTEKRTVDEALAKQPLVGSEPDQRFVMLLLLSTLQHLGQLDGVIAGYLTKPLPAKRAGIINALRLGAAQLLILNTPAHAAVNETVALVKRGRDAGLAGLVNAVLQKIAAEKPALPEAIANLPQWLRARWEAAYGAEETARIATISAARTPLDLNCREAMEGAVRLDSSMLRFTGEHAPVEQLPGYDGGAFFVQDLAASYPVRLLGDVRERQVLDVCAAPGGKTMQLIRAGAFVTALDRSAPRMRTVKANLKRMGMEANSIVADALEWQPSRAYDAILLDAPCTASGTWRHHPEMPHILAESEIAEMAALQRELLARCWNWLKPGGKLVYSVCSLEAEEGEQQVAWFLAQTADAQLTPIPAESEIPPVCIRGDFLRTLPAHLLEQGGMDGFFAACFMKR